MSANDDRRGGGAPTHPARPEDAPGKQATGDWRAVVSRLPAPPNVRIDGLDPRSAGLAAFVAGAVDAPSTPANHSARAVQLLVASRTRDARRRQARQTIGGSLALGAFAAAALVAWTATRQPPTLSYTVDGAAPPVGGLVRGSAAHEPELAFSDGTNIHVLPSARARVLDVGKRGARLMLEDGRAHVHVAHRPGADWQVQAGAFVIHVHGTAFYVQWNAAQSRLDLQMEDGVVSVDGPRSGDTVTVRGGQSLSVRLDGTRMVAIADPSRPAQSAAALAHPEGTAPTAETASAPSAATPPSEMPRPSLGAIAPRARWSERLADGEAAGILADAQRRGLPTVLAGASSEDLAALADAARFRKQDRLARRVLLAQRHRFPGTLRAEEASFLLGRLADGPGGRASDALAWYDGYLRETPSGAYAAEAMGRMMLVLQRQQRTEEARTLAADYLRRFPEGVYARAARAVASSDR